MALLEDTLTSESQAVFPCAAHHWYVSMLTCKQTLIIFMRKMRIAPT